MYRIVVGNETLWTPTLENNNYLITDPTLTLESNKPATLNFTVPNISVKKDLIELIRPEIMVFDNDRRIFRGRVLTNEKDFKRNRSIYCEGELAYLRDVIVRPAWTLGEKSAAIYFRDMINHYNDVMNGKSDYKKFIYGGSTVFKETIERKNDQYPDMLSELTDKLLNKYGGYFLIRPGIKDGEEVNYIYYYQDADEMEDVNDDITIQYGRNLLDLTESTDATPVYTRIIPLGGQVDNERVTIEGLSIDAPQINITKYGLIEHVETYDDIKDASALRTAGQETLDNVAVSDALEITALNSRMPDGSYGVLTCGKTYRILSAPHDYVDDDSRGRLNRQELKLAKPLESRYTFGKVKTGITQEAVSTNRAVDQVTKLAQMTSGDVAQIKNDITQIQGDINTLKSNYVVEMGVESNYWAYRKWSNGLFEYFSIGLSVTWSAWTETASGSGIWTASADISLPKTMTSYTAFVTIIDSLAFAHNISQTTTKITINAETTSVSRPTASNVNVLLYYLPSN